MPEPPDELPAGGTVRPVVRWGIPVMHRPQQPVTDFDAGLRALVADMVATMYAAEGVGLAACQIGVDRQVFVFDCPDADGVTHRGIVCNPRLVLPEGKDRRLDDGDEGCLSFPGGFVPCARPDDAQVQGQGLTGEPVSFSGTGLLARCLQHEADHCHGTVFGDRLNRRTFKRLQKQVEAAADEFPPGWPAYGPGMTQAPDPHDVETRAELLPEEASAGSEDPHAQAEVILAESEERTLDPEGTGAQNTQTSTPEQRPR